jgi:D-alanyl-D-alanine carboxypeptidase
MRKILLLVLLAAAALPLHAQRRRAVGVPSGNDTAETQRLQQIVAAAGNAALNRTPAVSIAVQHGRAYADGGFGLIAPETHQPATAQSIYWIASATKPFTAAAVMRFVERGALPLDEPIRTFFPELTTTATVRQLLNQTSGLPDYTSYLDPYGAVTPQQVLDIVRTKPASFAPGSAFAYSNSGYYLLGLILEQVGGKPWSDVIGDELAKPFGLASTSQCGKPPASPAPHGYSSVNPATAVAPSDPSAPFAAGSLCSSAADLARFSRLLRDGTIVSRDTYARMSSPTTLPNGATVAYGFGLDLHSDRWGATVGHDGLIRGYQSVFAYYPERDLTVAVLVNRNGNGLAAAVLADVVERVLAP